MKRQLTIYRTGNLKQVGWNHQYIEVPQIKFQGQWLESIGFTKIKWECSVIQLLR